jgi:hypothetical protein
VVIPHVDGQYGTFVSSPNSDWTAGNDVPYDDIALCIAGEESGVLAPEADGVDLRAMSTENVLRSWPCLLG